MFKINDEIKEFIAGKNLKPLVVFRMVDDVINEMLALKIPKQSILDFINEELNTNIKYSTFLKYVNKKGKVNKIKPSGTTKKTYTNPLQEMLGSIRNTESTEPKKKEREIKII
jgi:hypothetical protein